MQIAVRVVTAAAFAAALGSCGYRELKAPCKPEEGAPPALSYAPPPLTPITGSPLGELATGAIPVADPCGLLRRVNSSPATAIDRSPVDNPL